MLLARKSAKCGQQNNRYLFDLHEMNTVAKFRISNVRRGGTYTNQLTLRMGDAKLLLSLLYCAIRLFALDFILKTSTRFVFSTALTLRRLMSYIYMEHPFLMFLDHTQRRSTVGRTPLDE